MKKSAPVKQEITPAKTPPRNGVDLMPPAYGISFVDSRPIQKKENNTGLPDQLKSGVESLSGIDISDVKVHYNSSQPAQLNAHAYAQGNQIHIAPGQEKHLPHEAWHVVQQRQGRVKPTMQLKGKVNINDDLGLENEADMMGGRALKVQKSSEGLIEPRAGNSVTQSYSITQRVWNRVSKNESIWSEVMDGVTWHSDSQGLMWFELTHPDSVAVGNPDSYRALAGIENKRSWVAWNSISVLPHAEFTADLQPDFSASAPKAEDDGWNKWNDYMNMTIGSAKKMDNQANVHKTPEFNASTVPGISEKPTLQEDLNKHIANFEIITKKSFDLKLWQIAENLAKIPHYTCIVSEAGKSNFWITARILKKVKTLGGNAPLRIISVPTQEQGIKDGLNKGALNLDLANAGEIVFLDDGSFSGSQLAKLITKVTAGASRSHVGLVAVSQEASEKIKKVNGRLLANPHLIGKDESEAGLNDLHHAIGIPVQNPHNPDTPHKDGNHLSGFYYKVADFASVRNKLLTGTKDGQGKTPISGYSTGRGVFDPEKKSLKTVGATEPYKELAGFDAAKLGLEVPVSASSAIAASAAAAAPRLNPFGLRNVGEHKSAIAAKSSLLKQSKKEDDF